MRLGPHTGPSVVVQFKLTPQEAAAVRVVADREAYQHSVSQLVRWAMDIEWEPEHLERARVLAGCASTWQQVGESTQRVVVRAKRDEHERWRRKAERLGVAMVDLLVAAVAMELQAAEQVQPAPEVGG